MIDSLLPPTLHPIILFAPWILVVLLVIVGLQSLSRQTEIRRAGREGEDKVDALLRHFFQDTARNLYLPDGRGGLTEIDHAALTARGILLLETKHLSGDIVGSKTDETWTKTNKRGVLKLPNPLLQHRGHVRCVEQLGLGVPLIDLVVIVGGAQFPQGIPDGVRLLGDLPGDLKALTGDIDPTDQGRWRRLLEHARTDRAVVKQHVDAIESRHGRPPEQIRARWSLVASAVLVVGLVVHQLLGGVNRVLVGEEPALEESLPDLGALDLDLEPLPVAPEPVRPAAASPPSAAEIGRQPGQLSCVEPTPSAPIVKPKPAPKTDDLWIDEELWADDTGTWEAAPPARGEPVPAPERMANQAGRAMTPAQPSPATWPSGDLSLSQGAVRTH